MEIQDVNLLLLEYASGNFSKRGKLSGERDELDALVSGINMLGEELEDSTVSKKYFMSIFNAVQDMIIVTDKNGFVQNMNKSALRFLGYSQDENYSLIAGDFFQINQNLFFFRSKKN